MIYTEAVDYIHSLLKFGVRPGLSGMDALLCFLGNPHKNLKYVHVAGTNGKGSVSTAVSEVLTDAGYKVGLYTSPYVTHFLERIRFCGEPVEESLFAECVEKVKNGVLHLNGEGTVITEFEALTAAAFLCCKALNCDVVVLEVGLGGRLDATNVIDTPLANVITSLSLDHTAILGDTIEKIAYEKCGTIKENGNVISSFGQPENALDVIRKTAESKNCSFAVPDESRLEILKSDVFGTDFIYKNEKYSVSMPGLHQVKNMTAVIECCDVLKNTFNITSDNIKNGISASRLPARVEVISKKPLIILDGGHNEDGAKAFFETLKPTLKGKNKVYVLAGMMADKAVETSLRNLMKTADCFVCVTPENPRAVKAAELSKIAEKYCADTVSFDSPISAVDYILEKLTSDDVFCAVGSLYLAGEIREYLIEKTKNFC